MMIERKMTCSSDAPINTSDAVIDASKKTRRSIDLRKYTQQIWLAGLGAFSRAEEEGGKLFDSLVKVGEDLEHKTTHLAEKTVDAVDNVADLLTQTATHTRGRVEQVFTDVVTQATTRLGLQATKQSSDLSEQMQQLSDKIDALAAEIKTLKSAVK